MKYIGFVLSSIIGVSCAFSALTPKPFAVNLKFSVEPSRRQDFLTLIKGNQRKTLDLEPKALQYFVGESIDEPNKFYIHEEFVGAEGFEDHRAMPHAGDWAKFKSTEPFTIGGDPKIGFYDCSQDIEKIPVRKVFAVSVELCLKPDMREEFLEVITNSQKCSIKEPLCLQYSIAESTSDKNQFILHEEYESKAGFEAHIATPHFKIWEQFVSKEPFSKPPVIEPFRSIE